MNKELTSKKIEELQALEQHLQNFLSQKQAVQIELNEIENALSEIKETSGEVYKITAGFLIQSDKESVKKELDEKKKLLNIRVEAISKQEKLIEKDVVKLKDEINKLMTNG